MKKVKSTIAVLFLLGLLGCSKNELRPYERSILGTWRLYEVGGSTGYQWYVNSVPANPPQTLTFLRNGSLRSRGTSVSNFEYPKYEIVKEDDHLKLELSGSKNNKGTFSSSLRIEGDSMQIAPPCFEGCHYGFVKIK